MKMHQKGFLLVALSRVNNTWDYNLVQTAQQEYDLSGNAATNTLHVALNELAAAGLIVRLEEKLVIHPTTNKTRLAFRYRLSDFGRERMLETGLLSHIDADADADCAVS